MALVFVQFIFVLTLLIKMCFLISIFLCFALVPKLVPRTVDFHWYWYRILKFWYRDNPTEDWSNDAENSALHHINKLHFRCINIGKKLF